MLIPGNALTGFNIPAVAAGAPDPYFANVVALLHLDGANGGTTFTDNAPAPHSFSATGGAVTSTSQFKFGTASLRTGTAGDYISAADSADWHFGSSDFTCECWARFDDATIANSQVLFGQYTAADPSWLLYQGTAGQLHFFLSTNVTDYSADGATTLSDATWYHVAACRDGNTVYLYLNGVLDGQVTVSGAAKNSAQVLSVGTITDLPLINTLIGNQDDIRITNGVARYPGGTTFAVPTAAFPDS